MPLKLAPTFQPSSPGATAISNLISSFAGPTAGEYADQQVKSSTTALNNQKLAAPSQLQQIFDSVYNAPDTTAEAPRSSPSEVGPMPGVTTHPDRNKLAQEALGQLAAAGVSSGDHDIGKLFRSFIANVPQEGANPNQVLDRAMLGAGDSYASTQGGFAKEEQGKMDRTKYEIDNKPVSVGAGATLMSPQGEHLGQGRTTKSVAEGETLEGLSPDDRRTLLDSGGWTTGADGKPVFVPGGKLTNSVKTDAQNNVIDANSFDFMVDKLLKDAQANPAALGATGMARGAGQDVKQQIAIAKDALGGAAPGMLDDVSNKLPDYDPKIVEIRQTMQALPFVIAKEFGQSGHSLSNEDRRIMADIVGDPNDPTMNPQKLNAKIMQLKSWVANKKAEYGVLTGASRHPSQNNPTGMDPAEVLNPDVNGGGDSGGDITIDIDGNLIQ